MRCRYYFASCLYIFLTLFAHAQATTGQYANGTFDALGPDTINVGNLNLMLTIPVLHKAGRAGTNFTYDLSYNGLIWSSATGAWVPDQNWGWAGQTQVLTGYLVEPTRTTTCQNHGRFPESLTLGVAYHDTNGVVHHFTGRIQNSFGQCPGDVDTLSNTWSTDGLYHIGDQGYPITNRAGVEFDPPLNTTTGSGFYIDTNGNEISTDGSGNFTDTTGATALSVSGAAPSNQSYTYTDASGASRAVTVAYTSYTVRTSFGCSGVTEFSGTSIPLIDTITLPDTSTYHFTYEATPGVSGAVTGRIGSIRVPAGGTITYSYPGTNNGINCADGTPLGLNRIQSSTSGSPTRTYTRTLSGSNVHTAVVNEADTHLDYDFVPATDTAGDSGLYQTALSVTSNGSGTAPLATQTCYNGASQPCTTQSMSLPITEVEQYSTWDGLVQSGGSLMYDSAGNLTSNSVYDVGTASRTRALLLTDARTYSNGLLTGEGVGDSTGTISTINYTYDSSPLQPTSGVPQHNAGVNFGNVTQVSVLTSPGQNSNAVTTNYTYYDTGSLYSQTSSSGGVTQYSYDSTNTHPTAVTPPDPHSVNLATEYIYDAYQGQVATATNPNNTVTSITTSDGSGHPSQVLVTNGSTTLAKTTTQAYPTQTTSVSYQGSSTPVQTDTYYDVYGRPYRTASQSEPGSLYVTDTCYDPSGRVHFRSYPYKTAMLGSPVCTGLGDLYSYDLLGRVLSVTHGDSPATSISYLYYGNSTKVTDENGVTHIYQVDGAGRPTITCEVTSTALNGVSPASCGTLYTGVGFVTTYSYTHRATAITQGTQTRSFTSDGLGRPTSKQEPEGNWTFYTYSSNSTGNVVVRQTPKAGQTDTSGNPGTTTNATTQYDQLGRVVSISYDDGLTPTRTFTYDVVPSGASFSVGYAKGMMTGAATGAGASTFFGYDAAGRVQNTQQCLPGWCGGSGLPAFTRGYGYDWQNHLTSEQYSTPSGASTLGYTVNLAGQLATVTGGQDTSLSSLYTAGTQTPLGPTTSSLGNGISATLSYDVFGHRSGLGLQLGSTPLYAYTAAWSGNRVTQSSDSVNGTGSYVYDALNRLQTASIGTGAATLSLNWGYDRYGNRLSQSTTGSYPGTVSQPLFSVDATTNRITSAGYSYDAAGNLLSDGANNYTYDAEGNVVAISGATTASFTYDALNQRVLTTIGGVTRGYGFNAAGQRATVWDGSGNLLSAQYYAGGQPLAYYLASDGHVRFQHQNWVGTERFRTTSTGATEGSFTSLPFGDSQATASGADTDPYHYAGLDSDATGLQHATFRDYSSVQGRWLRPDPYMGSYVMSDPQSLNRYSYILNGPLAANDPMGLYLTADGYECGNGGSEETVTYVENTAGTNYANESASVSCTWVGLGWSGGGAGGGGYISGSTGGGGAGTGSQTAAPSNGKQEPPPPCQAKILNATNNQFGTNYTDANVSSTFNYSTGAGPGQGTLNLNITGSTAGVSPGYYPLHWYSYVIGYGSTLHVVSGPGGNGGLDSQMTVPFGPNQGTFHIDSGFPRNPIGAVFHYFLNFTKLGGYPKC